MRYLKFILVALLLVGCGIVDQGEVATLKRLGEMHQTCYGPGWYWYNPLTTNMDEHDALVQRVDFKKLGAATYDTQEIHVDVVINLKIGCYF